MGISYINNLEMPTIVDVREAYDTALIAKNTVRDENRADLTKTLTEGVNTQIRNGYFFYRAEANYCSMEMYWVAKQLFEPKGYRIWPMVLPVVIEWTHDVLPKVKDE